jgi:hypothetical protein
MKLRWLVRLAVALLVAIVVPACHHSTRKSSPPPAEDQDKPDPNAPPQKP